MKKYKIDLNDSYELHVKKECSASAVDNDLYVYVGIVIVRKNSDFYLILSDIIYEQKWISKIIGTWDERVKKAERKLIKKAKKTVNRIPEL